MRMIVGQLSNIAKQNGYFCNLRFQELSNSC